jgi:hypothetical protein
MSDGEWSELNYRFHSAFQGGEGAPPEDPRWLERLAKQAVCLPALVRAGVLTRELPWVDWGCGDARLAEMLERQDLPVQRFDRYMTGPSYLTEEQLAQTRFGVVLNTSVFEHVRSREPLEEMVRLLAPHGVFAIHTLVREEIPPDPEWFYLLPVHCALYTNRSMQMLFEQWGFHCSLYHVESRMWFWFREESEPLKQLVDRHAQFLEGEICFKKGFADYWK